MPTVELDQGRLRLSHPTTYQVEAAGGTPAPRAGRRRRPPGGTAAATDEVSAALLEALGEQRLELVQPVDLVPAEPGPGAAGGGRRGPRRSQPGSVRVELDVAADEDAVVLLEQDGLFSWQLPVGHTDPPATEGRRSRAAAPTRAVRFEIDVQAEPPSRPGRSTRGAVRGPFGDFVVGRVRAYVLKFAARAVAGKAMAFLERDVRRGLVSIAAPDVRDWRPVDDLSDVPLPADHPARLLLLVHGTFSSTVGSFGALPATEAGHAFVTAALASYDAVLGFDHPTLSLDPLENATDLLRRLAKAELPAPPKIDVLCYSRGALVTRSLVEYLLPSSDWRAEVDRIVFVGAANGGTALAEPDNWHSFVDLYTTLAVASARAIGLIAGAAPVAEVVKGLVESLGAFVKYLVSYSAAEGGVPGLAAMRPGGEFVRRINESQPGQPLPGTPWYVVSSDFEARLFGAGHEPAELPRRLVAKLVDGLVDQLLGGASDLVVDTASMSAIDAGVGGFVKDVHAFGVNSRVYHLRYFVQPEVCAALSEWLGLARTAAAPAQPGTIVAPSLPRMADVDLVHLSADDSVADLRRAFRLTSSRYLVVDRPYGGETLHYVLDRADASARVRGSAGGMALQDAFGLREADASDSLDVADLVGAELGPPPAAAVPAPAVVLDGGAPVAVIAGSRPPVALDAIPPARVGRRRGTGGRPTPAPPPPRPPSAAGGGVRPPGPPSAREGAPPPDGDARPRRRRQARGPQPATAYASADMPARVQVGEVFSVGCHLSLEQLAAPAGRITVSGTAAPVPGRAIILQVVPKTNAEAVGADRVEVELPGPGEPRDVYFDVRATDPGICEVWVVVRQGPAPLLTLRLKAVASGGRPVGRARHATAEATVSTEPVAGVEDLQWLRILERQLGGSTIYRYELTSPQLGILEEFESRPLDNRADYVRNLFREIEERWVSTGEDAEAFEQELRAFGADLFGRLFPDRLQQLLWDNRDQLGPLFVLSTEPFVPWELVHLTEPGRALPDETLFLGQLGVVRWLYGSWPRTTTLRARKGRVRVLVPDYVDPDLTLAETAAEGEFLTTCLGAVPVGPTERDVRELLRDGGFDVLHFAGHGVAAGEDIANAKILLAGRREQDAYVRSYLSATTVQAHARLAAADGSGPLVVLNACQVGRVGHQLSSLGGFSQAFLKGGAGAFVSSLWSVGDIPARRFVETFYDRLLAGEPLSAAVVRAREQAREAGDATWLAYVVYGNPTARLDRKRGG